MRSVQEIRPPQATAHGPDIPKTTPPNGITGSLSSRDPETLAGHRAGRKVASDCEDRVVPCRGQRLSAGAPVAGCAERRAQAWRTRAPCRALEPPWTHAVVVPAGLRNSRGLRLARLATPRPRLSILEDFRIVRTHSGAGNDVRTDVDGRHLPLPLRTHLENGVATEAVAAPETDGLLIA